MGLILYAIYIFPRFDLTDLSNFAEDNFALTLHMDNQMATEQMQDKLTLITTWPDKSGLKLNNTKTELCSFYKRDPHPS